VALTVVLLVSLVGTVMVIALLCLPVATAEIFLKRLYPIMFLAIILNWIFTFSGCFISFKYDLPTGACIIVLTGTVFFIMKISVKKML
jgi:zinc transport system permease protein